MKPVDVKRVYREEPMTAEEWDVWKDRILRLAESEKKEAQHEHDAVDSKLRVAGA